MIRRCKGGCGKHNTCQPYKDARSVEYVCQPCLIKIQARSKVIHRKGKLILKVAVVGKKAANVG